jgi:hypothetical protein
MESSVTIFLDIEKAFDTVWYSGPLLKLLRAGVTDSLLPFKDVFFLKKTCFRMTIGVTPQGVLVSHSLQ